MQFGGETGGDAPVRLVHGAGEIAVDDGLPAGEEILEHPADFGLSAVAGEGGLDAEQRGFVEAVQHRIHVLGIDAGEILVQREIDEIGARQGGFVLHQASPSFSRLSPDM